MGEHVPGPQTFGPPPPPHVCPTPQVAHVMTAPQAFWS